VDAGFASWGWRGARLEGWAGCDLGIASTRRSPLPPAVSTSKEQGIAGQGKYS
jgi:hypothetical protein